MEIYRSETKLLSGIVYFLRRKKQCRRLHICHILGQLEQSSKSQIRCEDQKNRVRTIQIRCEKQKIGVPENVTNTGSLGRANPQKFK